MVKLKNIEIISTYKADNGHTKCVAKCPYCGETFVTRKDYVVSGNTKSCGCLRKEKARQLGQNNKGKRKGNPCYQPIGCDYIKVFYNSYNGFFIVDCQSYNRIKEHTWYAKPNADVTRIDPVATIDGKQVYLSRFLMNTPDDLDCDHINCVTQDARICNLRNCTAQENNYNRKKFAPYVEEVGDKFVIKNFAKYISPYELFDTRELAESTMDAIGDEEQNEFYYWHSQAIAKEFETYEFKNYLVVGEILEEIYDLPEKHIFKIRFRNILRDVANGKSSEEQMMCDLMKLRKDYIIYKKQSA